MMRSISPLILVAAALWAHHSITGAYDVSKPTDYRATIVEVTWRNPHSTAIADVQKPGGLSERWVFETGSPNVMSKAGIKRDFLKQGDVVTFTALPSKDGSKQAYATRITWADGRSFDTIPDRFNEGFGKQQ